MQNILSNIRVKIKPHKICDFKKHKILEIRENFFKNNIDNLKNNIKKSP